MKHTARAHRDAAGNPLVSVGVQNSARPALLHPDDYERVVACLGAKEWHFDGRDVRAGQCTVARIILRASFKDRLVYAAGPLDLRRGNVSVIRAGNGMWSKRRAA